jgi:hypothetical protein
LHSAIISAKSPVARYFRSRNICWYLDNENKGTRWLGELTPGEDKTEDMLTIQRIYAAAGYDIPLNVVSLDKKRP